MPTGRRFSTLLGVSARQPATQRPVSIARVFVSALPSVTWPSLRFLFVSSSSLPLAVASFAKLARAPISPRVFSSSARRENVPPEVPVGVVRTVDSPLVDNSAARTWCTRRVSRILTESPRLLRCLCSGIRCVILRFCGGKSRWRFGFSRRFDAI